MISADSSSFSENTSPGGEISPNQSEIQERASTRAGPVQISDRSDQDRLHRGGGDRPPNITDFPTQEELGRHVRVNEPIASSIPETSTVFSASPDDETPKIPGPSPSGKETNYHFKDGTSESETFVETQRQQKERVEQITQDWGKLTDEQSQEKLKSKEAGTSVEDVPILTRQGEIVHPEPSTNTSIPVIEVPNNHTEGITELPSLVNQTEPEKIAQDPLTNSAENLISKVINPGDTLGDLRFSEQREHELGQKYRVYTSGVGREILLTPEQEIDYAKSFLERQNASFPTEKPEPVDPITAAEQPVANTTSKDKLTPTEMDQLIAETQTKKADDIDNKIKEYSAKVKADETMASESEESKPSQTGRLFSAAETARAKVAEIARAAALKTPGGNFVYRSAERYLNNFDWRDKDKVAWAAGIATGFTTNTAMNMVLPGAGSIINSVGTTAVTHLLSSGINSLRLRGIERSIKQNVNNLSDADAKAIDVRSFRDQYDQASRLLKTNGLNGYQTEMTRISEDLLSQLGYKEKGSFGPIVETLTQELQNKIFKYSKANERVRSFAAGMKVGAVTQGITNQLFDINKFVEHKLSGGPDASHIGNVDTPLPDGLHHLSQNQVDLINRIHQDPEAWKTFTSLSPEQWSGVGRLYEAGRLANVGIDTNPLIDTLTSVDVGHLININHGDTVSNLLEHNGHHVTWTTADSDLFGGHILANYQMLAETHNRMVESGLATNSFPTQQEVLSLIEHARGGDVTAFHDLQTSLDWIPVNQKLKILDEDGIQIIKRFFENNTANQATEGTNG